MQGLTFRIIQFLFTCFPPPGRPSIAKADPVPIESEGEKSIRTCNLRFFRRRREYEGSELYKE